MAKNKKNLQKIPKVILYKVKSFKKSKFTAVAVVCFLKSDIQGGKLKKFGISYDEGGLTIKKEFIPRSSSGRYSRMNRFGKTIVRKDLPMITKTFSIEAPNYGDWSKGSHEINYDRKVYRREFVEPKNLPICPELVVERDNEVVVGFRVKESLGKTNKELKNKLLFHLNLLQESFGTCDIVPEGEPLEERKFYKKLSWEVLPPGWWRDKSQIEKLKKRLGDRQSQLFMERLEYIASLNPLKQYEGHSYLGSRLYYIFVFKKAILAECPMFGNAAYLLKGGKMASWQEIFVQTKRFALNKGATRILHMGDWKKRLSKDLEL